MTSTAWGGLLNGQIPLVRMTVVRGEHFEPQAAAQLLKLEAAFQEHFGKPAIILEGYRSLATQQQYWSDWQAGKPGANRAAYPGTSNHGYGRAADFASSIDLFDSAEHQWMVANAPAYGWHWGEAPDEAWHFTYYPGTAAAGGNATPITNASPTSTEDEDDDMAKNSGFIYTRSADKAIVYLIANTDSGFTSEYTDGSPGKAIGGTYNNGVAAAFGTGSYETITEGHASAIKADCAKVRTGK